MKTVLVLGGVDVAAEKELHYGIWNSWWKSRLVRYGITHAGAVLAVDDFLRKEAVRLAKYEGENISIVPTGYDYEFWRPSGKKENVVLTVASCPDMLRVKLKGVDVFLSVARKLHDLQFQIIGLDPRLASALDPPANVQCLPFSSPEVLLASYQRAKVYCQLSYREGLPNSLCEAMLCECIPVGTRVGGIPTAIGESGFLVDYPDEEAIVQSVRKALASPPGMAQHARERISSRFTIEAREDALKQTIHRVLQ